MERNQEIYQVTLVGGVVNVVLLLFKFVAGIVGHSAAMVADAVHSLSDFVTDVIVLVFVHILMDGDITLREAHNKAPEVENLLRARYGEHTHVAVHVEPQDNM